MRLTADSKKLAYGPGTFYAGFPVSLGFGVGGQSYSNFWASTVKQHQYHVEVKRTKVLVE